MDIRAVTYETARVVTPTSVNAKDPAGPFVALEATTAGGMASIVTLRGELITIVLAAGVIITRKHWWSALWGEWLTSVDHKRIGVMYVLLGCILLLRGFIDALMMRAWSTGTTISPGKRWLFAFAFA